MRALKAREFLWVFLAGISLAMIAGAFRYVSLDPVLIPRRNPTTTESYPWVFVHVLSGTIWLVSGFLQFVLNPRSCAFWHRLSGTVYSLACVVSCSSLVVISSLLGSRAPFGPSSFPLSIYALVSLALGLIFVALGDIPAHRAWIIRSMVFALVMPLSRLDSALSEAAGFVILRFDHMTFLVLGGSELVIRRWLDFPLWSSSWPMRGIPVLVLLAATVILAAGMTYSFEQRFVDNLIF